jgi:hypothetical protein
LMPLAGAALFAASGTLGDYLTDVGINDKWMKQIAAAIQPGSAVLLVLVRKVTADKVLEGASRRRRHGAQNLTRSHQGSGVASGSGRRASGFTCLARLSALSVWPSCAVPSIVCAASRRGGQSSTQP